ncbi:MAG: CofH family radical SAM protein [Bacteroidales bacterium]|jgi:cyclic dehypoxanthinyl futalosine synthase|nr:CofH family radical SAM protein [Bacteroidales bacterium]
MKEISFSEALSLYLNAPLEELRSMADTARYSHIPQKRVSWQIDRNVNITNACVSGCRFCNFHCKPIEKEKVFVTTLDQYKSKIAEMRRLGGDQLLLQGGLHPDLDIVYYENLFRELKKIEPSLKLNALGPPEIAFISRISGTSCEETLSRLREAGLDTLPGAGAEILSDRVRKIISPGKPTATEWCNVMEIAHKMGIGTTATMVYGHIETMEERMAHLFTIRDLQSRRPEETPGFRAFISWPMQLKGTLLVEMMEERGRQLPRICHGWSEEEEFLRTIAISRIVLHNITHIQASWLTVGLEIAKKSLHYGADDMGSIMIEENVISAAGASNTVTADEMQQAIREEGFEPWLRRQDYSPADPVILRSQAIS